MMSSLVSGKEADDNRLLTEADDSTLSVNVNSSGTFRSVTVEIELDALAVNTLLQSHHVNDIEGTAGSVAFDAMPQASLEEMLGGQGEHVLHVIKVLRTKFVSQLILKALLRN